MKSQYLPKELIEEILCRLPVKSILRFTCICKSWYSLIKNPNFISTHFQKSTRSTSNRYLLQAFWDQDQISQISLRLDDEGFEEYMQLHETPLYPISHFHIVGSCNGLICLFCDGHRYARNRGGYKFVLWNPLVGRSISLPLPNSILEESILGKTRLMGFGFDSKSRDYKVLIYLDLVSKNGFERRAELYSFNSNSWKNITQIDRIFYEPGYFTRADGYSALVNRHLSSAFVNGALHWVFTNQIYDNSILVFDVSDEVCHEICLPEECNFQVDVEAFAFEASTIAVTARHKYETDIWVMKEYGVVSSWVKLATVHDLCRDRSRLSGFRNNGEALIIYDFIELASHKLNDKQPKRLMILPTFGVSTFHSYVESLVLLDIENNRGASDAEEPKYVTDAFLLLLLQAISG